jgi:hypothetical protein
VVRLPLSLAPAREVRGFLYNLLSKAKRFARTLAMERPNDGAGEK